MKKKNPKGTESTEQKKSEMIEVIDPKAIIDIKCSFSFYQSMFACADFIIKDKDKKEIEEFYNKLKDDKSRD